MPEVVANRLKRHSLVEKMLGSGVAKRVRSTALCDNSQATNTVSHNRTESGSAQPSIGTDEGVKDERTGTRGADFAHVAQYRFGDTP